MSHTHDTVSPVMQEQIVNQRSEMIVEDATDIDDVATRSEPVEDVHPLTSSKDWKSTMNTRSCKRKDAEYSNLPPTPPSTLPRTRASARIAATSEGLYKEKKKQGRKG